MARPRSTWLECDLCGQWRRVGMLRADKLPETWRCEDNPDPAYNRCAVPQELTNDQIDVLLGLAAKPPKLAKPKRPPLTPQAEAALRESEAAAAAAAAAAGAHGKSLGAVVEQLVKQAKLPPLQARAVQWHVANLEYGCATPLSQVAALGEGRVGRWAGRRGARGERRWAVGR